MRTPALAWPVRVPVVVGLLASTVLVAGCGPEPERDDLSLGQAKARVDRDVDAVAARLGSVSYREDGDDSGCSDELDDRAGVSYSRGVTVAPRNAQDPSASVLAIATEWEKRGWERAGDGVTIELRKDSFELEIEPADVPDRYVVTGFSPCVPEPQD